jgi:hypothetical protein
VKKENAELENDHKTKGNDFKILIMKERIVREQTAWRGKT